MRMREDITPKVVLLFWVLMCIIVILVKFTITITALKMHVIK